jgi:hypothetical protein
LNHCAGFGGNVSAANPAVAVKPSRTQQKNRRKICTSYGFAAAGCLLKSNFTSGGVWAAGVALK